MTMVNGRVIESVGGFHTVVFDDGAAVVCRARGRLKRDGAILVGDRVAVGTAGGDRVIERVEARTSELIRPPIANVDLAVVVMAFARPEPSWELLDRILVSVAKAGLDAVVVMNKRDLAGRSEEEAAFRPYRLAGYPVVATSVKEGAGLDRLREVLSGRISVFAGPSGVGKSSLLNELIPGAQLETGDVSEKARRGRHTTRRVGLLALPGGGWVADAPGFSTLDLGLMEPRMLGGCFPEIDSRAAACRFTGCLHRSEPDCAVKEAKEAGKIDPGRYERYLRFLAEVEQAYERRY